MSLEPRVVVIDTSVTMKYIGKGESSTFEICVPVNREEKNLGTLRVMVEKVALQIAPSFVKKGHQFYSVALTAPVASGSQINVEIKAVYGEVYEPLPKKILQVENQYVMLNDTMTFVSPYDSELQNFKFRLPPLGDLQWATPGSQKQSGFFKYPEMKDVKALTSVPLDLHFMHPHHLGYFSRVERRIEVSHWGNIAFTEQYKLHNGAAGLEGMFSRIEFSKFMMGHKVSHALTSLEAFIPRSSRNVHYRDAIGNVSSSYARREHQKGYIHLEILPRYPMLGGWNADFELSYNIPAKSGLFVRESDSSEMLLSVPFFQPFAKFFAEEVETVVILPEGSQNLKLSTPLPTGEVQESRTVSWFDVFGGRPTLSWTTRNVYSPQKEILTAKLHVGYTFRQYEILREPILFCLYFFIAFMAYIVYGRFSLRIVREGEANVLDYEEYQYAILLEVKNLFEDLCNDIQRMLNSPARQPKVEALVAKIRERCALVGCLSRTDKMIAELADAAFTLAGLHGQEEKKGAKISAVTKVHTDLIERIVRELETMDHHVKVADMAKKTK